MKGTNGKEREGGGWTGREGKGGEGMKGREGKERNGIYPAVSLGESFHNETQHRHPHIFPDAGVFYGSRIINSKYHCVQNRKNLSFPVRIFVAHLVDGYNKTL